MCSMALRTVYLRLCSVTGHPILREVKQEPFIVLMDFPGQESGQSSEKMAHLCSIMSGPQLGWLKHLGTGITLRFLHLHVGSWAGLTQRLPSADTIDQSPYREPLMWLGLLMLGSKKEYSKERISRKQALQEIQMEVTWPLHTYPWKSLLPSPIGCKWVTQAS